VTSGIKTFVAFGVRSEYHRMRRAADCAHFEIPRIRTLSADGAMAALFRPPYSLASTHAQVDVSRIGLCGRRMSPATWVPRSRTTPFVDLAWRNINPHRSFRSPALS
jgi:hypothetical protein